MSNNALGAARIDVWLLKEIEWHPKPVEEKKKVKIVMQTLNGCIFITSYLSLTSKLTIIKTLFVYSIMWVTATLEI